jgi:hypothetical protein
MFITPTNPIILDPSGPAAGGPDQPVTWLMLALVLGPLLLMCAAAAAFFWWDTRHG